MRIVLLLGIVASVAGCHCSPATPSPVTLRIVNDSRDPMFVDGTNGRYGLEVMRQSGATFYGFDDLACECRFCSKVCSRTCLCPAPASPTVLRIGPGEHAERTWNGVVQLAGMTSCESGGCLDQENAPLDETFRLKLCFSSQRPTGVEFADGGVGFGELPQAALSCVEKLFVPQDGVVEIRPPRGVSCQSSAECKGEELCFDGACAAGCPANEFPEYGSNWTLHVAGPENMGFFTKVASGADSVHSGTGELTSALYQGTSLQLRFKRQDPVEGWVSGGVTVQFPPGTGPSFEVGARVSVVIVEAGGDHPNRAVVIRMADTGQLLLAADMGQGKRVLDAAQGDPVAVTPMSVPLGCRKDSCGKQLYFELSAVWGPVTAKARPGELVSLKGQSGTYWLLNVTQSSYQKATECRVSELHPYVLYRERTL
jgi:hypothetical protein